MKNFTDIYKPLYGVEYKTGASYAEEILHPGLRKQYVEAFCHIAEMTFTCSSERTNHRNREKINKVIIATREALGFRLEELKNEHN